MAPLPALPRGLKGAKLNMVNIGEGADGRAVVEGAAGQGGVLDDFEAVAVGERAQGFDIGRVTVQIDRQDGAGLASDEVFDLVDIDGVVIGRDVAQNGKRAALADGAGGGDIGIADGDDLVAGSDAAGAQRQQERDGAGVCGDGVTLPHFGSEGGFKLGANRVAAAVIVEQDGLERRHDLVAQRLMGCGGAGARDAEGPVHFRQALPEALERGAFAEPRTEIRS